MVPVHRLIFVPDQRVWEIITLARGEDVIAEKYIARSSAIAARLIGGEMMIMSAVDSTFFTLNEVATVIWQAADGCTSVLGYCSPADLPGVRCRCGAGGARRRAASSSDLSQHGILFVSEKPHDKFAGITAGGGMSLLAEMNQKALGLGIPISVHLDSPIAAMSGAFIAIWITMITAR